MDDFNFFLKLAKPLILNLSDAKDRAMAALWLKKLCDVNSNSTQTGTDNIYVEYLKLLLLVMQGNRLTGIFEKPPPPGDLHELLPPGKTKAKDMTSLIKPQKNLALGEKSIRNGHPRVVTSIGGDMCEYVAVQEIPNFGIHGYYALSTEPLPKWTNPQSSESAEPKIASSCFKNTCESLGIDERDSDENEREEKSEERTNDKSTTDATKSEAGRSNFDGNSKKKHEKMKHSEKSLRKIFQAQRSEIVGVETRPCWGRSRYIDRLIDESPHLVGDLDLSEADAMLHLYRDKKYRKVINSDRDKKSKICAISSRRRQVETRLDMAPCASIPVEAFQEGTTEIDGSRTCVPPTDLDFHKNRIIDQDKTYDFYHSDNEDYYPIESARSNPQEYDSNTYDQCESQLIERADYADWRNYAYEPEGTYVDEFPTMMNERNSYVSNIPTPKMAIDSDDLREMRRLVEDPNRAEPPSRGKLKAPRRKANATRVERTNDPDESWNPSSHSTHIEH